MSRPSTLRSTTRTFLHTPTPSSSTSTISTRSASTTSAWPSKTHLRRTTPTHPNPLPALYPKRIVLSDGSTFTAHITSPSPSTIRLTRDVTNNPLWAPGTEKRGLGEGAEEGRVGRFRRRFEELSMDAEEVEGAEKGEKKARAFAETDLEWMSEGAVEEKVGVGKPKGGKR